MWEVTNLPVSGNNQVLVAPDNTLNSSTSDHRPSGVQRKRDWETDNEVDSEDNHGSLEDQDSIQVESFSLSED